MNRWTVSIALAGLALLAAGSVAAETKIAVIDVERVVRDSDPGKGSLQKLKELQDAKVEEGRALQASLDELKDRFNKQRFTLTDDKLEELSKEIEDKNIALKRYQDDAQRALDEARRKALDGLEAKIMPIITQLGTEQGYTLIFNKFQSGLVYASETVDITDEVIRRFNTAQ